MFIKTITDYLKEKANSTIIISLIIFYALCNCRWIFASLFTDQNLIMEKYGLLKHEYICQNFPELNPDNFWFWFCNLMPFALTYIYVWWIPKLIINPAYKKQINYATERREMKLNAEMKLRKLDGEAIKIESKNTEAILELENKKDALNEKNPQRALDEEYKAFQANRNWTAALSKLRDITYGNASNVKADHNAEVLMLLDVNELTRSTGLMDESITITEKGKAFLKRALEDELL